MTLSDLLYEIHRDVNKSELPCDAIDVVVKVRVGTGEAEFLQIESAELVAHEMIIAVET